MKTNKNTQLKTQIKIVKTLLDGSHKSQRQIAAEINREESTVSKALSYLDKEIITEEKFIQSGGRSNKGVYKNKLCHISYEVDRGIHILNFFKKIFMEKTLSRQEEAVIIRTLTESDKFISIIIDSNTWLKDQEGKDILLLESTSTLKDFFKKMLQLSPTFLKVFLSPDLTFRKFKKTWLEFNPTQTYTAELIDLLVYLELAKHSILTDGLEGNDMQKAINYITENKNDFPDILPSIATSSAFRIQCIIKNLLGYSSKTEEKSEEKVQLDPEVEAKLIADFDAHI